METTNTFVEFKDSTGEIKRVSIETLIFDGAPINMEGEFEGEEMELVSNQLVDCDGDPL